MTKDNRDDNLAANAIRHKLDALYANEPSAKQEVKDVMSAHGHLSKHQRYMRELSNSGRSLAEIQMAWHEYYEQLPDEGKHQVWQEFYKKHEDSRSAKIVQPEESSPASELEAPQSKPHSARPASTTRMSHRTRPRHESVPARQAVDMRQELLDRVQKPKRNNVGAKHNVKALAFGLSMGATVVLILMFSFFNERFITPFIRPSYAISTPIITDPGNNGPVGPEPKIIIPKINLEAPVVYDEPSIEEKKVQTALERGVLHYSTTPNPGELGNGVIFGHSSSNMLNKGKYKFAFLLLKSLDEGDTFIVQKDGKRYVYKVFKKYVTTPKDISVLGANDKKATMTLVTCDPPGMSTNRLIVVGEQIFPDPGTNKASTVKSVKDKPAELPSNSPSLWQRIKDWL